jgi:serine/threonine protein kinase
MKNTGLICTKCGFKNLVGEKYCSECGNYLLERPRSNFTNIEALITCNACGFQNDKNNKFCSNCGNNLDEKEKKEETQINDYKTNNNLLKNGTLLQNRYKITKLIGQGGMGAIYLADDTRFSNRVCVLKEMLDNFPDDEQRKIATSNFLREADMLANLHHDGIPEVYDRFSEGNRHYLVMEYIQGTDLEQKIEQSDKPFDEKTVLNWAIQICDILNYLHTRTPPIIYRDIKPANLILTNSGKIYMVDFGIARFFNPVKKGTMVGTQGYAPPEQYRGLMEPRSDIFALGATMHHLLTGRDPQEEAPFSFPKVRELNSSISVATEKLIEKALEKDVSDRFETAEEMLKEIMKITSVLGDSLKVCPYCQNKISKTKQFCPYCHEYIGSIQVETKSDKLKKMISSNIPLILSLIFNLILIIYILVK